MTRLIFVLVMLLACAQTSHAQEKDKRLTHALIGSYVAASAMDLSTTMYCRGAKTCHEANPILNPLEDRPIAFGAVKGAFAAAVATILIKQHKHHPRAVRWIAAGLAAGSVYVAVRNVRTANR